ncbi:DNA polymerase epsilon subunit 4 [Armigeres subalbatus]|uniref:DNA polymerase epsilon subunit 4 n=1 Tax=Armigeres subalbatus TaxID=124917 RepID=UPI002ED1E114
MEELNLPSNEKSSNVREFIDSEEIDFGTEPPSHPTNVEKQAAHDKESNTEESEEQPISTELEVDVDVPEAEEIAVDDAPSVEAEDTPDSEVHPESTAVKASSKEPSEQRLTQFPLSKIKSIMKFDSDVHIISAEAIFLVTRAAELFVQTMAKEAHTHTVASKKKTIVRRDVDMTIESVDTLVFLEGMMNV